MGFLHYRLVEEKVLSCPYCQMPFSYGWPCQHEFFLFLLEKGQWKCSNCGNVYVSTHKIISSAEIDEMVANEVVKELEDADLRLQMPELWQEDNGSDSQEQGCCD